MTDERIAELRRVYTAMPSDMPIWATRTRWGTNLTSGAPLYSTDIKQRDRGTIIGGVDNSDSPTGQPVADFIIAAHASVPELLNEIERLRAELQSEREPRQQPPEWVGVAHMGWNAMHKKERQGNPE